MLSLMHFSIGFTLAACSPIQPPLHRVVPVTPDSATVVAVVERFHRSLAAGDSAAALALLAPDAIVMESGGLETRAEYRAHHLPADIAFAAAVPAVRNVVRVAIDGNMAWIGSTSVARGRFRDREVNSAGAELMVLVRTGSEWRISAIHWSSRALRNAAP